MSRITTHKDLQEAIRELERKSSVQEATMREHFEQIMESVKPTNILKSAFQQIATSDELKNTAINTAIGLGTGFITKKLYVGRSANLLKKLAGTVVQFAVANFVRKKAPIIRERIAGLSENHKG